MTTITSTTGERPPIGDAERTAWTVVVALTGLLGAAGFVNSFERVETAMAPYFGALAWTVPLSIDVGILIFTALDLLMAYRDMRSWWLRYVPRALVVATIYLNIVGETTVEGRVAHAVLPGLWVVAVEVAGTAVRSIFGLRSQRPQLDRIRRSRWLLAPVSTARLRRRMVLREETSLTAARQRDLAFELTKADMRDRYGHFAWMWKAPRRERLLLRRGEISPITTEPDVTTGTGPAPGRARTLHTGGPGPSAGRRPARALTDADLLSLAATVADGMTTAGVPLTRRPFIAHMRAAGHPVGNARAAVLLDHLRHRAARANGHQPEDTAVSATAQT